MCLPGMVIILYGNSEIGAHVQSGFFICKDICIDRVNLTTYVSTMIPGKSRIYYVRLIFIFII